MLKVIITSTNPAKIEAVKIAFESVFPETEFEFIGVKVASDVSDQPMSSKETKQGVINRINNAKKEIDGDYYVSLEGGLEKDEYGYLVAINWSAVEYDNQLSTAHSASFRLPNKMQELIENGLEMGVAADQVFGTHNVKHDLGTVGILTKGLINRIQYVVTSVQLALITFINPDLY